MKCDYCGTGVSGNEVFCRYCGTRLQHAPEAVPVAIAVAEEAAPVYEEPVAEAAEEIPVPQPEPVVSTRTLPWQPYGGAPAPEESLFDFEKTAQAPALQLPTKRSLVKMIFLSILTLGIYPMVIWSRLVGEVNMVASRYDGERSMSFFGMMMLSPITLGIHSLVWIHKLCRRIGTELQRRDIHYSFGAKDFWLWNMLFSFLMSICSGVSTYLYMTSRDSGVISLVLACVSLLTVIGPFVFTHKLMKSMNLMNGDFNLHG